MNGRENNFPVYGILNSLLLLLLSKFNSSSGLKIFEEDAC